MQGTFYQFHVAQPDAATEAATETASDATIPAHINLACHIAKDLFRLGKRIYIFTDSEQTAHQVDEHLWGFEADSFVPHNLVGEGPRQGSPVEIGWTAPQNRRQVLINLAVAGPPFCLEFQQLVDFVPANAELTQAARERYKFYRQLGVQLTMAQAETPTNAAATNNVTTNTANS